MRLTRRELLASGAAALAAGCPPPRPPRSRPEPPYGVQSGDVAPGRAVIWSRSDRPARLHVEWSTAESFRIATRVEGPWALAETDLTARVDLAGLPPGADVFYRASFAGEDGAASEPAAGRLRTPPAGRRTVRFCFSGDEAGQGWGIDPAWGGMATYEAMRRTEPDFFVHMGDQIYADGPLAPEVELADGARWRNLVTPAKAKPALTLDALRGRFAYNWLDEPKRRFAAEVPFLVQWDDHEVRNNWFPGQRIPARPRRDDRRVARRGARAARDARVVPVPPRATERTRRSTAPSRTGPRSTSSSSTRARTAPRTGRATSRGGREHGVLRRRAARMARARPRGVARDVEGDRVRDAALARRARPEPGRPGRLVRGARERPRRRAARPRARARAAALASCAAAACATSCGSPPTSTTRAPSSTTLRAPRSATSRRSGSSSPARCTPAPSASASSTRASAPSSASRACRATSRRTARRARASSSSGSPRSTARREDLTVSIRDRAGAKLYEVRLLAER